MQAHTKITITRLSENGAIKVMCNSRDFVNSDHMGIQDLVMSQCTGTAEPLEVLIQ